MWFHEKIYIHIEKEVWKDLNRGVNNDYLLSSKMDIFFSSMSLFVFSS